MSASGPTVPSAHVRQEPFSPRTFAEDAPDSETPLLAEPLEVFNIAGDLMACFRRFRGDPLYAEDLVAGLVKATRRPKWEWSLVLRTEDGDDELLLDNSFVPDGVSQAQFVVKNGADEGRSFLKRYLDDREPLRERQLVPECVYASPGWTNDLRKYRRDFFGDDFGLPDETKTRRDVLAGIVSLEFVGSSLRRNSAFVIQCVQRHKQACAFICPSLLRDPDFFSQAARNVRMISALHRYEYWAMQAGIVEECFVETNVALQKFSDDVDLIERMVEVNFCTPGGCHTARVLFNTASLRVKLELRRKSSVNDCRSANKFREIFAAEFRLLAAEVAHRNRDDAA